MFNIEEMKILMASKSLNTKDSTGKSRTTTNETPEEKMERAIQINKLPQQDKILHADENSVTILFTPIFILSQNDLLRIPARRLKPYKESIIERVIRLLKDKKEVADFAQNASDKLVIAESMLKVTHGQKMDFDNSVGSYKFLIDGIVRSGLIIDDSPKYFSYHLPEVINGKKEDERVSITHLSIIDNPDKFKTKEYLKQRNKYL